MEQRIVKKIIYLFIIAMLFSGVYVLIGNRLFKNEYNKVISVGYPPVSTSLPLFVAIEEGLFDKRGLTVNPVRFETANQIVEALVTDRIDATSVCADYPLLSVATLKSDTFKIYAWEMLDTTIAFDMILAKRGSNIKTLADLDGKTIATYPGSQLKHYLGLILSNALDFTPNTTIVEMAPANHISALASGSVDALFTLEPLATIALVNEVAQVVSTSPISKYIGDGEPMPAASFAVSTSFTSKHPEISKSFVNAMWEAIALINEDQEKYRYLYPKFTAITAKLAERIPVTHFATVADMDFKLFQKEIDILFQADLLEKNIRAEDLIYGEE